MLLGQALEQLVQQKLRILFLHRRRPHRQGPMIQHGQVLRGDGVFKETLLDERLLRLAIGHARMGPTRQLVVLNRGLWLMDERLHNLVLPRLLLRALCSVHYFLVILKLRILSGLGVLLREVALLLHGFILLRGCTGLLMECWLKVSHVRIVQNRHGTISLGLKIVSRLLKRVFEYLFFSFGLQCLIELALIQELLFV